MMIEIKGIGLPNRGAELMLLAILQMFEDRGLDHCEFVVEPLGDYKTRAKYKLFQKTRFFGKGLNFGFPFSFLPKIIRQRLGLVNLEEIELVLDASGFAYGDKWGKKLINDRLGKELDYFKKKGVKVVLLPQAFGSFEDKEVATLSREIIYKSDLVIARDSQSLEFVNQLGRFDNLHLFPDFTNLVKPVIRDKYASLVGRVCIIPNFQMIRRGNAGDNYKIVLAETIKYLISQGQKPFLLVHEGIRDLNLAIDIANLSQHPIDIIDPQDALDIKSIISQCSLLIGSRFHGIVSALSTGVPAITLGWSHKYEELLKDYQVPELLVNVDFNEIKGLSDQLLNNAEYANDIISRIEENSKILKAKSTEMWNLVFDTIKINK